MPARSARQVNFRCPFATVGDMRPRDFGILPGLHSNTATAMAGGPGTRSCCGRGRRSVRGPGSGPVAPMDQFAQPSISPSSNGPIRCLTSLPSAPISTL
ncbi:hypothetical protein [Lysobacter gummosus]|uniref:hypothetical protein n=1 Tax=Lysobacter gummosus TaxID=262324 RepID=UPI003639FA69